MIKHSKEVSGHDIDLIRDVAMMMNFTIQLNILNETKPWGFLLENGTSGGTIKKIIDKEADIGFGGFYLTKNRAKFMSFCVYSDVKIVLVIPPGKPLSAFEKLFRPFSFNAWIALLLTVSVGILIVFFIRRQERMVQDFIFGHNTGNPYFNMLDIVLNGSQTVQPGRNFSRVILTLFVVFCIIIRTTYQASLFQFLQNEQKHGEIQTVDELIEKEFDVFMYESFQELSNGLKIHQR
jgi:hypothetical protein